MTIKLTNGFNNHLTNQEYHDNRTHKSSSSLKLMLKNPREYYSTYVLNEGSSISSAALDIGSYTHTRVLEPHLVEEEYAIYTGRRQGIVWEEFKFKNKGKTIITSSQKSLVDAMVNKYEETSIILGLHGEEKEVAISTFFSGGNAEETIAGELDGYPVKVRTDYRKMDSDFASINDLKTTQLGLGTATTKDVEEICDYWYYDLSAALYVDLMEQVTGTKHDFFFIFMSKKDYVTRIFKASDNMIERGRAKYKEAIVKIKEAEKTGIFFKNVIEELG